MLQAEQQSSLCYMQYAEHRLEEHHLVSGIHPQRSPFAELPIEPRVRAKEFVYVFVVVVVAKLGRVA